MGKIKHPLYLYRRYIHDIVIAVEAIKANKMKSFLTALGIMFGVAAVISMLAIGKGAQQEVLEQIKLVGVNNIIVTPNSQSLLSSDATGETTGSTGTSKKRFSRGLSLLDAMSISEVVPTVDKISPVISMSYYAIKEGKSYPVVLEGVSPEYFGLLNMNLDLGKEFSKVQAQKSLPVCVIGANIRSHFFNQDNPIGQHIKCGKVWLKVIGVVEKRDFTTSASDEMGISSSDNRVIIPVKTMLLRFKDRAAIKPKTMDNMVGGGNGDADPPESP